MVSTPSITTDQASGSSVIDPLAVEAAWRHLLANPARAPARLFSTEVQTQSSAAPPAPMVSTPSITTDQASGSSVIDPLAVEAAWRHLLANPARAPARLFSTEVQTQSSAAPPAPMVSTPSITTDQASGSSVIDPLAVEAAWRHLLANPARAPARLFSTEVQTQSSHQGYALPVSQIDFQPKMRNDYCELCKKSYTNRTVHLLSWEHHAASRNRK
ncbi:hypothetical protein CRE_14161 [Caenorhabditis remanei]|uniref:Uncharacterized protein n=1 Tax=Caenorhabditis remanei TaxID=31234 RepID=E3MRK9_CAERE|nr:hypothetical protein CRE_14161 [Caenorhabditis remanei]